MTFDLGDIVLLRTPITVSKVIGNRVECTWMVNNLKQTGIFDADDLSKRPSQIDTNDL